MIWGLVFDERLEALGAARVAQLAQRLRFDLADALARDLEVLADFLERVVALLADAEAHAQDLLFARRQRRQHLAGLLGEVHRDDGVRRRDDALVLDEVAQVRIFLFADRRLEGDRLLGAIEYLVHLVERQLHLLGDLFRRRLAAELLHEIARGADELVDRLDHVHRDADGPGLIGDRAGDGLTDPPRRVGRELVAALVLELVDRLHEADVALLNQVEELQAAVRVLLGDRNDQAQVGLDELRLGALRHALAFVDVVVRDAQRVLGEPRLLFDALDLALRVLHAAARLLQLVRVEAELLL